MATALHYRLVPVTPLPQLDVRLNVRRWLLPPRLASIVGGLLFHGRYVISIAFFVGYVLRFVVILAPPSIGRTAAVASLALQIPGALKVTLSFRVRFLERMLRTFEFWYYTVCASVWGLAGALYFGDLRTAFVPTTWLDLENATLMDAYFLDMRQIVLVSWLGVAFFSVFTIAATLNLVPGTHYQSLVSTPERAITLREVVAHLTGILVILAARIVYRKSTVLKRKAHVSVSIQCIAYTCKLQFEDTSTTDLMAHAARGPDVPPALRSKLLTLRHIDNGETFATSDVLLPALSASGIGSSVPWQALLYTAGVTGALLTIAVFVFAQHDAVARLLAGPAIGTTALFAAVFATQYQRALLRKLYTSFNFAFFLFMVTIELVCVCDLFRWQGPPTVGAASVWIWVHWALTTDALTPPVRRRLGFRLAHVVPVVLGCLVGQVALTLELVTWDHWRLQNHTFLSGSSVELSVVPLLISRILTVFVWCFRLLARLLVRRSENELMMLRGNVEYDSIYQRGSVTAPSLAKLPTASTGSNPKLMTAIVTPQETRRSRRSLGGV
ncbi:hypothetical protein PINS_up005257 [Pythium insidiosum]|nr:hypothetical protein PINS_up005257 [Pythium insidiosum]